MIILGLFLSVHVSLAQITALNASKEGTTDFGDRFYIYCSPAEGAAMGILQATTPFGVASTFSWERYDSLTNAFVPFGAVFPTDTLQSTIRNLSDGCYRVTIEAGGSTTKFQSWVLHNWIKVTNTEIPDEASNCDEFQILADYTYAPLNVYNTNTGQRSSVRNPNISFKTEWFHNDVLIRSFLSPMIYPPIASDTPVRYDLIVEDEFECTGEGGVDYQSKVTEADFLADPMTGEAVLEVNFTNNSINYDSAIWFFYKDTYIISKEIEEAKGQPVDSVDFILYDDAPMHRYEMSGDYIVRLVTVKINETGNCYDTLYMEPGTFIEVEDTLINIPNVFTPNGDGINDVFVITSQSLKSLNIRIYNRWGGIVHSWKYSNITSSDFTEEHSVWDGRVGNRMATPGVYYYVVQYEGRMIEKDDKRGRPVSGTKTGFIHLFRDKN